MNENKVSATFTFTATFRYDKEAAVYVAYCPALDVYSQGESEAEAREAICEAVGLYLQTAYDHARLDKAGHHPNLFIATCPTCERHIDPEKLRGRLPDVRAAQAGLKKAAKVSRECLESEIDV